MDYSNLCPVCFRQTVHDGVCSACGYRIEPESPMYLPRFTVLKDGFLVGKHLGAGGFGITYLAYDMAAARRIAIKEYFPSQSAVRSEDGVTVVPIGNEREEYKHGFDDFKDETCRLLTLNNCAHVVKVFGCFEANNTAYMVMEYVDGGSLRDRLTAAPGRTDLHETIDMFITLAQTLRQVHEAGMLHRDISPDNIMFTSSGEIKLIDFGAARYTMGQRSHNFSVMVKAGYAPPEQYSSNGKQGPWTDVYALASMTYYYLTGKRLPVSSERITGAEVTKLRTLRPDVPKTFEEVIDRCLELDFRRRYASMDEMLRDMKKRGLIVDAYPAAVPEKVEPPGKVITEKWGKERFAEGIRSWLSKFRHTSFPELEFLNGPMMGVRIPFSGGKLCVGRDSDLCRAVISNAPDISRLHAILEYHDKTGLIHITSKSDNGIYLYGGGQLMRDESADIPPGEPFCLTAPEHTMKVILFEK